MSKILLLVLQLALVELMDSGMRLSYPGHYSSGCRDVSGGFIGRIGIPQSAAVMTQREILYVTAAHLCLIIIQ